MFAIGERRSFFVKKTKQTKKSFAYDLNNKRERGIVHSRAGLKHFNNLAWGFIPPVFVLVVSSAIY